MFAGKDITESRVMTSKAIKIRLISTFIVMCLLLMGVLYLCAACELKYEYELVPGGKGPKNAYKDPDPIMINNTEELYDITEFYVEDKLLSAFDKYDDNFFKKHFLVVLHVANAVYGLPTVEVTSVSVDERILNIEITVVMNMYGAASVTPALVIFSFEKSLNVLEVNATSNIVWSD